MKMNRRKVGAVIFAGALAFGVLGWSKVAPETMKDSGQARMTGNLQPKEKPKPGFSFVTHVVDGDTIEVLIDGKVEKIRMIGIDTPETVDPRKKAQCFGKEASDKTKEMLSGKEIRLESDPTQDDRDKYGRLLRYIFLENGTNYNKWLVENGYAHEYTYQIPYKFQAEFKAAERAARDSNRGLWAPSSCNGITK